MKLVDRQINEKLAYILDAQTEAESINRMREVVAADVTFIAYMRMACDKQFAILGVPEGTPETYKPQTDLPDGIADTTLRQEFRRVRNFLANGTVSNLKPFKREQLWIQLLEGIHYKEAEVLTMVKDQTLLDRFPNLKPVLEACGVNITVPVKAEKKGKKK